MPSGNQKVTHIYPKLQFSAASLFELPFCYHQAVNGYYYVCNGTIMVDLIRQNLLYLDGLLFKKFSSHLYDPI